MRIESDCFLDVVLIIKAMLPLWMPSELRGLDPCAVLNVNEIIPALDAISSA